MGLLKLLSICLLCTSIYTPNLSAQNIASSSQDDKHFWLYDEGNYAQALIPMRHAANSGDAEAQFRVGKMYGNGLGTEKNLKKSLYYYELAAAQNNKNALNNLANMYLDGIGVEEDMILAKQYYERAAELGNAVSVRNLGMIYEWGYGVPENFAKARSLYQEAIKMGNEKAHSDLADLYRYGKGVQHNNSRAIYHYRIASESGHSASDEAIKELNEIGAQEFIELGAIPFTQEFPVFRFDSASRRPDAIFTFQKRLEKGFLRPGGNTQSIDLRHNGMHTSVIHQPADGHSKWVLPDFFHPLRENNNEYIPMWYTVDLHFLLDKGKSLRDYEELLQLRTFLSPSNLVRISLYKSGNLSLVTSEGEDKHRQFHARAFDQNEDDIKLTFQFSMFGNWKIWVGEQLLGKGRIDPKFVMGGMSNHLWVEGNIHIKHLTFKEHIPAESEYERFLYGWNSEDLDYLSEFVAKNFEQEYLYSVINTEDFNFDDWLYSSHEHVYTRRMDSAKLIHESLVDKKRVAYQVGLNVHGQNRAGQDVTVPLVYIAVVDDEKKEIDGVLGISVDHKQEQNYMPATVVRDVLTKLKSK